MAEFGPPFGGITRIRFKGSSKVGPLSHPAPPHFDFEITTRLTEVNARDIALRCPRTPQGGVPTKISIK